MAELPLDAAVEVLGNAGRRRELSADHTVVALAGAHGVSFGAATAALTAWLALSALGGDHLAACHLANPESGHPRLSLA